MVDCSRFLEGYSDYRDGLLGRDEWESFRAHLLLCSSCARYDRVVGQGVDVVRRHEEITPSADFALRLQSRLLAVDEELARQRYASGASVAVTLTLALTIGLIAWLPALRPSPGPALLPPVLAHAPRHPEVVPPPFAREPLLTLPAYGPVRLRTVGMPPYAAGGSLRTFASYSVPPYSQPAH